MIGAALPSVAAHWGSGEGQLEITGGVAGRVVGYAGPSLVGTGGNVAAAAGQVHCDMEFEGRSASDGSSHEVEIDEEFNLDGEVPDNTWDDGGEGGACHSTRYAISAFNTEGCGEAADHAAARANPATALRVFVRAGCDIGSVSANQDPTGAAAGVVGCAEDEVSQSNPGQSVSCLGPVTNAPSSGFASCRNDGVVDAANFGYANTNNGPQVPTKVAAQAKIGGPFDCSGSAGQTSVFVFENVDLSATDVSGPATHVWTTDGFTQPVGTNQVLYTGSATEVTRVNGQTVLDVGILTCSNDRGSGGGCMDHSTAAVALEDSQAGPDVTYQVCRDIDADGFCTDSPGQADPSFPTCDDIVRYSHHDDGTNVNPMTVPGFPSAAQGCGGESLDVVVFVCQGAHDGSAGVHTHSAWFGTIDAVSSGSAGFTDTDGGFCGPPPPPAEAAPKPYVILEP